jgi:uncharacterized membrane protein
VIDGPDGDDMIRLLKGFPGKPLHPPLTDASIGSYTLGVAALIAGKAGLQTPEMSHAALIAISFGLLVAVPTAITGLVDWLDIPRGTPAKTVATTHLFLMVATTLLFALTWLLQRPGYNADEVRTGALITGIVAELFLAVGSNVGGANVFVYGIRVLKREDTPPARALNPLGVTTEPPAAPRGDDPARR